MSPDEGSLRACGVVHPRAKGIVALSSISDATSRASAASERSKNIDYLVGIDHLRAFACLLIVLYHGRQLISWDIMERHNLVKPVWPRALDPLSSLVIEGHSAVALFMVLSAFIFTFGAEHARIDYKRFLYNRFLRTYPLFLALTALGMASAPSSFNLDQLLTLLLGLTNFNHNSPPFLPFSALFWTIAVEWQFYLLFPFLLEFLRPNVLKNALLALLLATIGRWLAHFNGADFRDLSYFTLAGRIDQFLLGMVAGFYFRRLSPRLLRLCFVPALCLVLGSLFWLNRRGGGWIASSAFKLYWSTWEGVIWAGFTMCYLALAPLVPRWLSRALVRVGVTSYSIYLWHFALITFFTRQNLTLALAQNPERNAVLNTLLLILPAVLALSALSYHVIERPFMRLRVRYLKPEPQ